MQKGSPGEGVRVLTDESPRYDLADRTRTGSELTAPMLKDQRHSRHDSSIASQWPTERASKSRDNQQHPMNTSFLLEESASEASRPSSSSSLEADMEGNDNDDDDENDDDDDAAYDDDEPHTSSSSLSDQGVTFDDLVDRLVSQPASKSDLKFSTVFLALYRNFAPPGRLLEGIIGRFYAIERGGLPHILKVQSQLRYVGLIEQWCGWYPGDFAHPSTTCRLRSFVSKLAGLRVFAQAAREIRLSLDAIREDDDTAWGFSDDDTTIRPKSLQNSTLPPDSTLLEDPGSFIDQALSSTHLSPTTLDDHLPRYADQALSTVEQSQRYSQFLVPHSRIPITKTQWRALMEQPDELIARELTRIDWIMFSSVRPRDLIRHVSSSKEQKKGYANLVHVDRIISHFNQLASVVANYILLRDKPKHRALMLEKFMRVARKLREINNYNALGAIIAGVKSTSVHRLGATRQLLPPAVGKDWLKLEILMSPSRSHSAYRLAWENSTSERIPYLPLHRRDLATAEEGNKTFVGAHDRINWKKFEIMGDVIIGIQRAQAMPYAGLNSLDGNEQIRELVLDVELVKDEEELYERSLQCEPSGRTNQGASSKFRDFFKR